MILDIGALNLLGREIRKNVLKKVLWYQNNQGLGKRYSHVALAYFSCQV